MIGGEGLTRLAFRGHESIPKRQATPAPARPDAGRAAGRNAVEPLMEVVILSRVSAISTGKAANFPL